MVYYHCSAAGDFFCLGLVFFRISLIFKANSRRFPTLFFLSISTLRAVFLPTPALRAVFLPISALRADFPTLFWRFAPFSYLFRRFAPISSIFGASRRFPTFSYFCPFFPTFPATQRPTKKTSGFANPYQILCMDESEFLVFQRFRALRAHFSFKVFDLSGCST